MTLLNKTRASIKAIALITILSYQQIVAVVLGTGGACRFHPSCSEYAKDCFTNLSVLRATYLTAKRILRCHPMGAFGEDPAPRKASYGE